MICRSVAGHALLVDFAETISEEAHAQVLGLDAALQAAPPPGLVETVPAFVNLLILFDPTLTDPARLEAHLRALNAQPRPASGKTHDILVTYDGQDLAQVAARTGLTEAEVTRLHSTARFKVSLYGFAPGYAYLGGLPAALRLDRKPEPLRDVPAGSVIIAGSQCLVTTLTMPTGWWIIGHSPARILTEDPARPFLFDIGDEVRFVP